MTKTQLFLLSLVGALPAAFLSYLLVMYLINQPSGANTMVMVFAIVTLLCAVTMAVIPIGVLTSYYSNYDPPRPVKKASKKPADEIDGEQDTDSEPAAESGEVDQLVDDDLLSDDPLSDELVTEDLVDDDLPAADDDDFADFDDLDEEEEKPKKKKKR